MADGLLSLWISAGLLRSLEQDELQVSKERPARGVGVYVLLFPREISLQVFSVHAVMIPCGAAVLLNSLAVFRSGHR